MLMRTGKRHKYSYFIYNKGEDVGSIFYWGWDLNCGVRQIGYYIHDKENMNKGLMTKHLKNLMKMCRKPFRLVIHKDNIASQKVAQKAGCYLAWENNWSVTYLSPGAEA